MTCVDTMRGACFRRIMLTLWTIKEVANTAQVNPMTIRRAIRRGDLEAVRIGKAIRITPEALQKFLKPVAPGGKAA